MTRSILSIAAALIAATTLFGSAAEACISCNYTPEVVNTPVPGARTFQKKQRVIIANERAARPVQKRAPVTAPAVKVAKADPAPTRTEPETHSAGVSNIPTEARILSGAPPAEAEAAAPETKPAEEAKVADLGCKKFIPTAGVTVTVPCE